MNLFKNFKNVNPEAKRLWAIRGIGWGLPIALVPVLRFAQDKDKPSELRKELFIRDFSSYTIGFGIYIGAHALSHKVLKATIAEKLSKNKKILLQEIISTVSYCLWSGVFGPKVSKLLNKRNRKNTNIAKQSEIKLNSKSLAQKEINFAQHLNGINKKPYNAKIYSTSLYSRFRI